MFKGLGGLGDMGKMMKAAQETQEKMARMQEDLALIEVIGESGAGLVKATATAKGELTGLEIDPSIFNGDDKEIVEDLILAAIKDAQAKAADRSKNELEKITEALGLPAGMKLPF
ncbi:MAG: YbaB/EbfC family nucleoid-associated protein [Paracoccaceae bacterium]|jgi:DNA-binding YbaB/EbfC family protein|uniref:YbaB/EbfC family nucleoid-associated protein n=1 Tax=Candidatus Salinivivens marinus TaxID=3381703 RepID=UPI000B70E2B6|nr:30S ribosomal protein S21 [Marinovum sp.]OUU12828.1 MAG: 30S ribosomal protein S21 [Rhodobacteraceae bacterium TMED38]PDH61267.1 MAG: 30S ribosomal protein S21 [Rhodobacteraceae bacterium MED-G08]|tara:strand:+ start:44 stop:388 length:345 start_codon:yes stop_codon:yes gene_type:complete